MRLIIASAVSLVGCAGLTLAENAPAAIRQATSIPAQSLGAALQTLAKERKFQIVYVWDELQSLKTSGAVGDLSAQEALAELLRGTGFTYKYLDEQTVTIVPLATPPAGREGHTAIPPSDAAEQRPGLAQDELASPLRLAQAQAPSFSPSSASRTGPAEASGEKLEEIIVSAQKRDESIVEVPISISAIGAAELEAKRVQKLDDYIMEVPNATFGRSRIWSSDVSIRGIGSGAVGGQFSAVAVTVDESSFGSTSMAEILQAQYLDVERVEILRGPQGTMTGANSIGGTINLITEKPDPGALAFRGTLDLGRYDKVFAKAVLNAPVSDRLALRVVGYGEHSEGAIENAGPAGGDSGTRHGGGRLALRWLPSDALTVDAAVSYERQHYGFDDRLPIDRFPGFDADARRATIDALAAQGIDYFGSDFLTDGHMDGGKVHMDTPNATRITDWLGSFRAAYEFGSYRGDLIYGHFDYDAVTHDDVDQSELAIERDRQTRRAKSDSVELRLTSKYPGDFNWIGGVSYAHDEHDYVFVGDQGDGTFGGAYSPWYIASLPQQVRSGGLFANAFWNITTRLHLSAGARWSRYESEHDNIYSETGSLPAALTLKSNLSEVSPRVALTYDLAKGVSAYAQFATGYRAGYGNNAQAVALGFAKPDVDPEHVKNYEMGVKGRFWEGRASVAVAAFYMDYTDLQVYAYTYDDLGDYYYWDENAGSAYARGFEFESSVRPVKGVELRASVGYLDSEVKDIPNGPGAFLDGPPLPGARPWTVSVSGLYSRPIGERWTLDLRADYTWQDRTYTVFSPDPVFQLPSFRTLDLSAGVSSGHWAVTAYADNVNDETYWLGVYNAYQSARAPHVNFVPRTYGLRVNYNFGKT